MFWRVAGLSTTSPIDLILDREEFSLEELLDEDDLIQECKSLNPRLVSFLKSKPQIEKLVRYVVDEATSSSEEKRRFKYPFISCEIFTCEIDHIFNSLLEEEIMNILFSFIEPEKNHSTLLSGYFSKVLICLLVRKTPEVMSYVQNHLDILKKLVDLISITSIMEVIIKLVGADDQILMYNAESIQWLENTNLLDYLVEKFSPEYSSDVHANTAETLCAIAKTSPSALAKKLSSPMYIGKLFEYALANTNNKTNIAYTLNVCITLLDNRKFHSVFLAPRGLQHSVQMIDSETIEGMVQNLEKIVNLLEINDEGTKLPTTYGILNPPLGIYRMKIVEFMSVLTRTSNDTVRKALVDSLGIQKSIDLFFRFPFNNILHNQVECIIDSCLESNSPQLIHHLLNDCHIIKRLLSAGKNPYASDDNIFSLRGNSRYGYMGHVTKISNKLIQASNSSTIVSAHLNANAEWVEWQKSYLQERNSVENIYQWACGRPGSIDHRPNDSDDEEYSQKDDFFMPNVTSSFSNNIVTEFENHPALEENGNEDGREGEEFHDSYTIDERLDIEMRGLKIIEHPPSWALGTIESSSLTDTWQAFQSPPPTHEFETLFTDTHGLSTAPSDTETSSNLTKEESPIFNVPLDSPSEPESLTSSSAPLPPSEEKHLPSHEILDDNKIIKEDSHSLKESVENEEEKKTNSSLDELEGGRPDILAISSLSSLTSDIEAPGVHENNSNSNNLEVGKKESQVSDEDAQDKPSEAVSDSNSAEVTTALGNSDNLGSPPKSESEPEWTTEQKSETQSSHSSKVLTGNEASSEISSPITPPSQVERKEEAGKENDVPNEVSTTERDIEQKEQSDEVEDEFAEFVSSRSRTATTVTLPSH